MNTIEISHVTKSFNTHRVLNDVHLTVQKGSTLVVIGRSGCGKSVLLKHMMGLIQPDTGSVMVDGN
jgi:phospholipid/cholesterol/gamma-HCH transport system ATP-binding protein